MYLYNLFLFVTLTMVQTVGATPLGLSKFRVAPEPLQARLYDIPIEALAFDQRLDHNNPFDQRRFSQNYWVSPGYAKDNNSPVLLYFCGETTCSDYDVRFMFPWAEKIGASVVVIEHRYYGASQPFAQNTAENLRWMTIPQAIDDFAAIVKHIKKTKHMTGPWIVSGGSYAGMLASYFRQTYPRLVTGAWASSAPVHVEEDYQGYDLQMVKNISESCATSLRKVTALAEVAVQDPTAFAELRQKFHAEELTDADDFLFGIIDVAAAAVQYRLTNVLCDSFISDDVMTDFANFLEAMATNFGYLPTSYSFASAMDTNAGQGNSDLRTFFYQQCNEYGLFQTAYKDPAISLRSQRLNMNYMRRGCERLFGRSFVAGTDDLNARYYYPLLSQKSSEIYFTNGSLDPWMPLGIATENGNWNNPNIYALMIDGSFHCDDLSYKRSTTTDPLKNASAIVQLLMKKWTRQ